MIRRLLGLLRGTRAPRTLGGFLDSLIQGFENRRAGLADDATSAGAEGALPFFVELYEKESERLPDAVRMQEPNLSEDERRAFVRSVDDLIRQVVLPAYARLAAPFTRRERNDFYLAPGPFHGLERAAWCVGGMALGAFVVWAPFIPLWEKEWVLPFALAGLVFPDLRRYFALRRYQAELNWLVAHADDETWRMEMAFLTREVNASTLEARLEQLETHEEPEPPRKKLREGEGGR